MKSSLSLIKRVQQVCMYNLTYIMYIHHRYCYGYDKYVRRV